MSIDQLGSLGEFVASIGNMKRARIVMKIRRGEPLNDEARLIQGIENMNLRDFVTRLVTFSDELRPRGCRKAERVHFIGVLEGIGIGTTCANLELNKIVEAYF